jgi:hypothetical protein
MASQERDDRQETGDPRSRLGDDKPACRIAISHTVLRYTPMADRRIDDACGFTNVVRADVSPIAFAPRVTATCGLTAALYWFQRGAAAAAAAQMHSRLVRIDQVGTFACRNVNGKAVGSRSEHATANAIDVTAFHFCRRTDRDGGARLRQAHSGGTFSGGSACRGLRRVQWSAWAGL